MKETTFMKIVLGHTGIIEKKKESKNHTDMGKEQHEISEVMQNLDQL